MVQIYHASRFFATNLFTDRKEHKVLEFPVANGRPTACGTKCVVTKMVTKDLEQTSTT